VRVGLNYQFHGSSSIELTASTRAAAGTQVANPGVALPRADEVIEYRPASAPDPFETCRLASAMSVARGSPEVTG
jgi:hypothetical protein